MHDAYRREGIAVQQPIELLPVHVAFAMAAVKPPVPRAVNQIQEAPQRWTVARDPIIGVVPGDFPDQLGMLDRDRFVTVGSAPSANILHGTRQTFRRRLSLDHPGSPAGSAPVVGESKQVERVAVAMWCSVATILG